MRHNFKTEDNDESYLKMLCPTVGKALQIDCIPGKTAVLCKNDGKDKAASQRQRPGWAAALGRECLPLAKIMRR